MGNLTSFFESNAFRTVLSVAALVATVTFFFLNRKKKGLSYSVVRNDQLFQVSDALIPRVEITLDGRRVANLSLVIIDISNSGNESIKSEDFEKPLTYTFGENLEIVSSRILRKSPEDLDAKISVSKTTLQLEPLLMNAKDSLSVEIILTAYSQKISHSARVVGVKKIEVLNSNRPINIRPAVIEWAALTGIPALFVITFYYATRAPWIQHHFIVSMMTFSLMLGSGIFFYTKRS